MIVCVLTIISNRGELIKRNKMTNRMEGRTNRCIFRLIFIWFALKCFAMTIEFEYRVVVVTWVTLCGVVLINYNYKIHTPNNCFLCRLKSCNQNKKQHCNVKVKKQWINSTSSRFYACHPLGYAYFQCFALNLVYILMKHNRCYF